jgi:hypothetical protein
MLQIFEYRHYAEQCRAMARAARNRARRRQFLQLAMQWETIARQREKLLAARRAATVAVRLDTDDIAQRARRLTG